MISKQYTCIFYETVHGNTPVEDFIEGLDEKTQNKFIFKKELLEQFGTKLGYPHTKNLKNELFELRLKSIKGQIRIIFFFYLNNFIILVHGFIKKTQKISKKEILTSKKRRDDFLKRSKWHEKGR